MLGSLLPFAGASLTNVAQRAGEQIGSALSFLDHLRPSEAEKAANESPEAAADGEESALASSLKRFHEKAVSLFRAAGIDLSLPVELSLDAQGNVSVSGAHPDLLRIEAVIAESPELSAAATDLVQQHSAVQFPFAGQTPSQSSTFGDELRVELDEAGIAVRS